MDPGIPQSGVTKTPPGADAVRFRNDSHLFVPLVADPAGGEHTIKIESTGAGNKLSINGFLVSQR